MTTASKSDVNAASFTEFKDSFSYGSRTDLNYKFLKHLSEDAAADFLQQLLWKLGDTFDSGQLAGLMHFVQQTQAQAYAGATQWIYDEGPFTPLAKQIAETKVGLLTSTGHFVEGDDPQPFGIAQMTQEEATNRINDFLKSEPTLSAIPIDTPHEKLRVRHGGYDIRGVQADPNVALPLSRLNELAGEGVIGELAQDAYSFVGACAQTPLLRHSGPAWVQRFQEVGIEAMLLVPV